MKSTDYYRGLAARLRAVDGPGNDLREFAASALCNAADILADHDKQAKARAERIQWIHVAAGVYVTRAGRNTFRLMEDGDSLSLQIDNGGVGCVSFEEIDTTTSIESASRKIRRWLRSRH